MGTEALHPIAHGVAVAVPVVTTTGNPAAMASTGARPKVSGDCRPGEEIRRRPAATHHLRFLPSRKCTGTSGPHWAAW